MSPTSARYSFVLKAAGLLILLAAADVLFWLREPGWTLGLFALAWVLILIVSVRGAKRGAAAFALAVAAGLGLVLIDHPNALAVVLCWTAIASAALLTRTGFDGAGRWALRLAAQGAAGPLRPILDFRRLLRRGRGGGLRGAVTLLALPVIGGVLFALLFAAANPVIGAALDRLEVPSPARAVFWAVIAALVWPSFRPVVLRLAAPNGASAIRAPELPIATLALSLVVFNAVFAVENALDLAFLWSGAALPAGVTLAEYAHRGAYLLIVTALLAGAFVLIAFRPGSAAARSPAVRVLLVMWIVQNLLLVASSAHRTLDYVDAYQMTVLRLAALAWMTLVATGLILICRRLLAGESARWLLNANALATLIVLLAAAVIDLGAVAAAWNVRHAREGDRIDLCYLNRLGSSALLPLIALERRAGGPRLRDRVAHIRAGTMDRLAGEQADWHSWTARGARRLARARVLLGPAPARARVTPLGRQCDGSIRRPTQAYPLTAEPSR
jgi:hypothetical protein